MEKRDGWDSSKENKSEKLERDEKFSKTMKKWHDDRYPDINSKKPKGHIIFDLILFVGLLISSFMAFAFFNEKFLDPDDKIGLGLFAFGFLIAAIFQGHSIFKKPIKKGFEKAQEAGEKRARRKEYEKWIRDARYEEILADSGGDPMPGIVMKTGRCYLCQTKLKFPDKPKSEIVCPACKEWIETDLCFDD